MSSDPSSFSFAGKDPFSAFWQDFTAKMMAAGMPVTAQNPSLDAMNQMRRIFFDSMAQHAEQFMRSEAFLKSMKQSMDAGLAWQQQLNQSLQKGLSAAQMPSRNDVEHLTLLVHGIEDRLAKKLDELSQRIGALEGDAPAARGAGGKAQARGRR